MMNINLSLIAVYLWLIMLVIVVVVVVAVLFIKNLAYRQQVAQLKKRLQELGGNEQYVAYLQSQQQGKDKIAAIKALRQQFPELSLLEANEIWQQVHKEQNSNLK
ncbi:hypothetical protein [Psychrobacter sp. I-STPA10]|uniref:hypothetical protein n=1 Tax=Psychrobacter sp. I-STPA10 TaxID=2585769 RepID=UPI001E5245E0|nr:hypothetical protein [Psychrobacter sp. I-STPA10]